MTAEERERLKALIRQQMEGFRLVNEITERERRAQTVEERWRDLDDLYRAAKDLGWRPGDAPDPELDEVRARWVALKRHAV